MLGVKLKPLNRLDVCAGVEPVADDVTVAVLGSDVVPKMDLPEPNRDVVLVVVVD